MMEIFDKKLIFSTTENILHLCAVETIYCVSIFYKAPPMFDQIYTIDAFVDHVMFPLVFSLQPQIDTVKYNRFLTLLKDIVNRHIFSISPRKFSLSFECASQQCSYVAAELQGCFFHYAKTTWRKTRECALQTDCKDVLDVTEHVRRATCLPLLPLNKIDL
jgi:hypothetical protein